MFSTAGKADMGEGWQQARDVPKNVAGASAAQQPLQILFSRAFISASSAPIVSTYFPPAIFETEALGDTGPAGLAAADFSAGVAGGATLS
jgi:hypothetical protein